MPTDAQLGAYTRVKRLLLAQAVAELDAIMSRVDTTDPQSVYEALTRVMPALVAKHGDAFHSVAAEWFEQTVGSPAVLADPVPGHEVESSARWAAAASATDTASRVADRARGVLDKHLKNESRATLRLSAEETPGVGWARVLRGSENCGFCVTLAGRGADYRSSMTAKQAETAKRPKVDFHDFCDCDVIAIRSDSDWPAGYDHTKYEAMYRAAREKAGVMTLKGGTPGMPRELVPDDDKTILQVMREMHGLK